MDTLFVARYPDAWFAHDCVLGEETHDRRRGRRAEAVAVQRGHPRAARRAFHPALARRLARLFRRDLEPALLRGRGAAVERGGRSELHVLPPRAFYRLGASRPGIASLFEQRDERLDGVASMHLWAHLWWAEDRIDLSRFHAGLITPEWIARGESTFAAIARRYMGSGT